MIATFILFQFLLTNSIAQCFHRNCGQETISSKIVNGTEVNDAKYPWAAFIRVYDEIEEERCAGTVISDRYILTAAHCVNNPSYNVSVILGETYVGKIGFEETNVHELEIAKVIVHEKFDFSSDVLFNDIALIKLKQKIKFNSKIQPICLPTKETRIKGELYAIGWGRISTHSENSPVLREVAIRKYNKRLCNKENGEMLRGNQICASAVGKDTCNGDSGGPLMMKKRGRMFIVGITSFGDDDCGTKRNSVFTRVDRFLKWIYRNTK